MARKKVRSSTATGAALPPAATGEAPAASGRWTRSGGRVIRLDTTTDHPTVSDSAGGQGSHGGGGGGGTEDSVPAGATPRKSKRIAAASSSSGLVAKKGKKTTPGTPEDEEGRRRRDGGTVASATVSSTSLASWPLPPRYPDYPSLQLGQHILSKKHGNAVSKWMRKCRKISKLSQQARRKDIPTLKDTPKDPLTADAVVSSQDKAMVWRVACSVVGVTSKKHDGELVSQCSGIVVGLDGVNKCAKILTAASLVCDYNGEFHDPTLMLSVHLPNKIVTEGRLLHFNVHYGVALLEIMGDFQLQVPSFGSRTDYGDDVFVLARDEDMSLMVRHGMISWDHPMSCSNHCMLLSCDIPQGASGGPVIDHDGNFIAIAVDDSSVTPVSMIRTCLDMWLQFSRVARPILGMQLEAVELLDVSRQEELRRDYNIADGFIVKEVDIDSTAETLGIRQGDVIVFQDSDSSTLPQLEDYLLSLGWGYLQGISLTTDLRVQVHNPMDSYSESITFPLQFSDDSKRVD